MTTWIKIHEDGACGVSYEEYISEDGKLCKQVWNDGYEEIFEVAEDARE